ARVTPTAWPAGAFRSLPLGTSGRLKGGGDRGSPRPGPSWRSSLPVATSHWRTWAQVLERVNSDLPSCPNATLTIEAVRPRGTLGPCFIAEPPLLVAVSTTLPVPSASTKANQSPSGEKTTGLIDVLRLLAETGMARNSWPLAGSHSLRE